MGRRISKRRSRVVLAAFAALTILALTGCENDLQTYVFDTLFGVGWRIASWQGPERVLPAEDWESRSHGFPQQIAISNTGKVHVVLYSVNDWTWLYTVREPGAAAFPDTYGEVATGIYTLAAPAMVLLLNDLPIIAYADRDGGGPGYNLCYQEKQLGGPGEWGSQNILYTHTSMIKAVSMFFLVSDSLKPRLFYQADDKVYHTLKTGTSTIDPSTPEVFLATALQAAVFKLGTDDVGFVYAGSSQSLSYTRFRDNSPVTIWSTTDPDVEIASVAAVTDASGKIHVVLGTLNPNFSSDPSYYTYRYLTNAGGSWSQKGSISGSASSGPYVATTPALTVSRDSEGEDHLHMAYTVIEPPLTVFAWYAYFDEGQWQVAAQSLDDSRNGFYPSITADDAGNLHLLYTDYMQELERELYYLKAIPEKAQDE
jgi:hypothetical protein